MRRRRLRRCAYVALGRQCTLHRWHLPARHRFDDDDAGYEDWRRFWNRITSP